MKVLFYIIFSALAALGLYLSVYVMLIGGIENIVYSISPYVPSHIVCGVLKIIFSGVYLLLCMPLMVMIDINQ